MGYLGERGERDRLHVEVGSRMVDPLNKSGDKSAEEQLIAVYDWTIF